MSRPNEGRKWRGKQPQPASRFKLSFRSGRSNFETYPYRQQTQPAVNTGPFAAGSSGARSGAQQLGNETPRGDTQGSTKRNKPAGWKLSRSFKSHADGQSTTKRAPPNVGEQMSFRLPTSPEISKGCTAYFPEIVSPPRNTINSLPYQSVANWGTARRPSCYSLGCPTGQCFHPSETGTESHYPSQPTDDGLSFPEVDFARLNNVAALEEYFENARIGGTFQTYGSQPDNCILEPTIMYSQDLETQPYLEDAAYHVLDLQQLTGIPIRDWEEAGYCYDATISDLMAAFAWHKERGIPWDFSFSEHRSFDEEDFHHSSSHFPYSQAPSRPSPQDMAVIFAEASRHIALYNKQWTLVQQRPTMSGAPAPSIPWPSKASSFSRQGLYERSPEVTSTEDLPKFTAHKFFCHAFGLHPIWNFQDDSGHGICFVTGETKDTKVEKLNGLRNQLKLEKVRWHEDKMKAAFGEKVANDECVKEVWAVVISLKNKVEQELEYLRIQVEGNKTT